VREDGGDGEASGALDVHEEGARAGDKHLQLVLAGLGLRGGVEEIDCENHLDGVVLTRFRWKKSLRKWLEYWLVLVRR